MPLNCFLFWRRDLATESALHRSACTFEQPSPQVIPLLWNSCSSFTNGIRRVCIRLALSKPKTRNKKLFFLSVGCSSMIWHWIGHIWHLELLKTGIPSLFQIRLMSSSHISPLSLSLLYSHPHCTSQIKPGVDVCLCQLSLPVDVCLVAVQGKVHKKSVKDGPEPSRSGYASGHRPLERTNFDLWYKRSSPQFPSYKMSHWVFSISTMNKTF